MDIPLKVVVRVSESETLELKERERKILFTSPPVAAVCQQQSLKIDENSYDFSRIYSTAKNHDIYCESIAHMISSVLEGFDVSLVSYGNKGAGKTFTLYGNQANEGVVLCFIKDLLCQLSSHHERVFSLNVAWTEITRAGDVIDILENASMVQCFSCEDVFSLLSIGLHNKTHENHNILSLVLEQQWTSVNGLNQHRQSTISFCDLCGTDREMLDNMLILKDNGLKMLEDIVLVDCTQYNETTLTAFLKDSFGGRAQTLMLLCVSNSEADKIETLLNLKFGHKAQNIINNVVMNTFSDNNVPVAPFNDDQNLNYDGLYFASQQWLKLLKNAESLFHKLFNNFELTQQERNQIEEWLYLKAECDECLSSTDISVSAMNQQQKVCLGPIEEIDESEDNQNNQYFSDNESESDLFDMSDKIQSYMKNFQIKNNTIITEKYKQFFQAHPKLVDEQNKEKQVQNAIHNPGRRKSIYDGETFSSTELSLKSPVKSNSSASLQNITVANKKLDNLNNNLRICIAGIESLHVQIEEIRRTISLKQKYFKDLIENSETRSVAKNRFNKKKSKLETEYEKTKKQLRKAVVNGLDKREINQLKCQTSQIEQRLQDLESIGYIAGESGHKTKKLQQSIKDSQKQLELLQKMLKKESEKKEAMEKDITSLKKEKSSKADVHEIYEGKSKIKNMNERISHLEHVLKEKSSNLKKFVNKKSSEKESLRQEIRNLRRTRDHLLEQRFNLDKKIREDKIPSFDEERKLVECDEAIEAIDAAIELKNELICGRKSIDTDESLQREKGEQMLMARLNKLSTDEMRTLLYKYFQKVVDLKESSKKLEIQFISLEREKDAWEWQEKILTNAIRQTRLESERNIIALQKQHETKLNLMLRHFAADTSASISSTIPDNALQYPSDLALNAAPSTSRYQLLETDPAAKQISQFKPVEKDRERKNKLFSKFHMLTRYHGDKRKIIQADIPQQNLKQLQISSRPSLTKVTREKNKIIIQNDTSNSK